MSREFILERIKSRQKVDGDDSDRRRAVEKRIAKHAPGILPAVPGTRVKRLKQFIDKAEAAQASVSRVSEQSMGKALVEWLRDHNLPAEVRMSPDKRLDGLRKRAEKKLTIKPAPGDGSDIVGVSHAECGIVETGTLALMSGPDNPTTLNFLPENHVVVLREKDVVDHYEDIWPRLRKRFGERKMPRTLNLITGPSRSADIEQTLILGAHGPVRLHILLIRD